MQEYGRFFIVVPIYDGGGGYFDSLFSHCPGYEVESLPALTLRKKSICDMCDENYFQGIFFA